VQPSHKLYILVDRQLSKSQQTVQACHVAIEFAKAYPEWEHQSIVVLGVPSQTGLYEWKNRFEQYPVKLKAFWESHWNNRLTALAAHGCDDLVKELDLV